MVEASLPPELEEYVELQLGCMYRIRKLCEKTECQSLFWINPHVLFKEKLELKIQNEQIFLSGPFSK